jgi:threonine aldolase
VRRGKKLFGGAMRQAGIIAAAGLYALQNNVERLAEDHENAARLAEGLASIPGVRLDPAPETNLLFVDISGTGMTATVAKARLEAEGVRASGHSETRVRLVTHLDISRDDIDRAIAAARRAWEGGR